MRGYSRLLRIGILKWSVCFSGSVRDCLRLLEDSLGFLDFKQLRCGLCFGLINGLGRKLWHIRQLHTTALRACLAVSGARGRSGL